MPYNSVGKQSNLEYGRLCGGRCGLLFHVGASVKAKGHCLIHFGDHSRL